MYRRERAKAESKPHVRRSIYDPLVLAAIVGLVSGTGIKVADEIGQSDRGRVEAIAKAEEGDCDRAYRYVQEAANDPKLRADEEFYQLNRETAKRCAMPGLWSLKDFEE